MSVIWHQLTGGFRRIWSKKLPTHLEFNSSWKAAWSEGRSDAVKMHSAPFEFVPTPQYLSRYLQLIAIAILPEGTAISSGSSSQFWVFQTCMA